MDFSDSPQRGTRNCDKQKRLCGIKKEQTGFFAFCKWDLPSLFTRYGFCFNCRQKVGNYRGRDPDCKDVREFKPEQPQVIYSEYL